MARYVDVDKLIAEYDRVHIGRPGGARRLMEEASTADVAEVKRGEWILEDHGQGTCNQCKFTQKDVWDMNGWQNYCGHCGAKMGGGAKMDVGKG